MRSALLGLAVLCCLIGFFLPLYVFGKSILGHSGLTYGEDLSDLPILLLSFPLLLVTWVIDRLDHLQFLRWVEQRIVKFFDRRDDV